jgi:hypothetical protein
VILVHYRDGFTKKLDPTKEDELCLLDQPVEQKQVSRIAIIDGDGHRVDLPAVTNGTSRMWVELVMNGDTPRGERVCMRRGREILKVTLYYSDGRVVVDL